MLLNSAIQLATRTILPGVCLLLVACNGAENYWSDHQLKIIASLSLSSLGDLPEAPSNRFADNKKAAALGKKLFFDNRFSLNNSLSCASCHQPQKAYTDGLRVAKGIHETGRNTQTLIGAAYQQWFYWDGRKDSLWSQALVPFESANEMASSRVSVLHTIGSDEELKKQYNALFGKIPTSIFDKNTPKNAGPWGDNDTRDNWYRIPVNKRHQINSAYSNVGKSIAAYVRTLAVPATKFDEYADVLLNHGEGRADSLITEDEKAGLNLYIDQTKTHCLRCHNGPLFTNADFHNIGSGNFTGPNLDFGRYFGVQAVLQDEFNCQGRYSDATEFDCDAVQFLPRDTHNGMQGAFKTPGLRYLNKTGPYFHDGRYSTVDQSLQHYLDTPAIDSEAPKLVLTEQEKKQLLAFIAMLNIEKSE